MRARATRFIWLRHLLDQTRAFALIRAKEQREELGAARGERLIVGLTSAATCARAPSLNDDPRASVQHSELEFAGQIEHNLLLVS